MPTVADERGNVVQEIRYDSFGRIRSDSNPELFVPIGFAGGPDGHSRPRAWGAAPEPTMASG
ncbi:MAG: hypothetical protein AB7D51_16290 [Desulfovibrionaceae bacterium]